MKAGLLMNLDKHSMERAQAIIEEEIGEKATPREVTSPKVPVNPAMARVVAARNQALNDAVAKTKAEKTEAFSNTTAGHGFATDRSLPPTTEASAPAESVQKEKSDAKG
jgi:hypothetical protein